MHYEEIINYERKEAAEEAIRAARVQDILDLLEEYGEVPENVKLRLEEETSDTLKQWYKLAAKADSIDAFVSQMK